MILYIALQLYQARTSVKRTNSFPRHIVHFILKCIGVGASKFLGVRKIFARISPNLPEKFSSIVGRQFFKIKQRWAPFLSVFLGSLPRNPGIFQTFS